MNIPEQLADLEYQHLVQVVEDDFEVQSNITDEELVGGIIKPDDYRKGFIRFVDETRRPTDKRKKINTYEYMQNYSTKETGVWIDSNNKQIVFCFRESVDIMNDWVKTNTVIGLLPMAFTQTARFQRSLKTVENFLKQIKGLNEYTIYLIGFSLGGTISTHMYTILKKKTKAKIKFVVFNRGSSPLEIYDTSPVNKQNRIHFHVTGDWISTPFLNDKRTKHEIFKHKKAKPHSLVNLK